MKKPLRPDDGRLKVNRDATQAQVEAIQIRWNDPRFPASLVRARCDKRFQVFLRVLIRGARA